MITRRITLALGAAGGGLLAAAFLSSGVANADPDIDVFGLAPITGQPETVVAVSGLPPLDQQVEGYQFFDFYTTPTGATTPVLDGNVDTDVSTFTTSGFTNTEYLVTASSGGVGVAIPTDGSVLDTSSFLGLTNNYSDIVGGTATAPTNTITDTLVTPFGDVNLSPLFDSFAASVTGDVFGGAVPIGDLSDLTSAFGGLAF
jgi:hypothetical protein